MNYSIGKIVKKVLIVENLEFLVKDKIKLILDNKDIVYGEILKIEDEYLKIKTTYFGSTVIYYECIKSIELIEE